MKPEPWWPLEFRDGGRATPVGHPSVLWLDDDPLYAASHGLTRYHTIYAEREGWHSAGNDLLEVRCKLYSLAYPEGKDET